MSTNRWWHIYRGELSSFEGATATVTCEDSPKHPREMPDELEGLRYVVSFDHEPTEREMRKVVGSSANPQKREGE